jgi:hypothetical protein
MIYVMQQTLQAIRIQDVACSLRLRSISARSKVNGGMARSTVRHGDSERSWWLGGHGAVAVPEAAKPEVKWGTRKEAPVTPFRNRMLEELQKIGHSVQLCWLNARPTVKFNGELKQF